MTQNFFQICPESLCQVDANGRVTEANPAFLRSVTSGGQLAKGGTFADLLLESDRTRFANWRLALRGSGSTPLEVRFGKKGLEGKWFELTIFPSGDEKTHFIVLRDVTETRKNRMNGYVISKELREKGSLLESLFEEASIGLNLCRMDGLWIESNPSFLKTIGYDREEANGGLTYWQLTPRKYEEEEGKQLKQLKETGRFGPYEKEFIRKDGSLVPVRLRGFLTERDGEVFIWSLIEDMSHEKLVQRTQHEFLSTVSHELRTPLTSLTGSLALLSGVSDVLEEEDQDLLRVAARNGARLELLVDDLLDLQKIELGKLKYNMKPHDLARIVTDMVKASQPIAEEARVKLASDDSASGLKVLGDEHRLTQILNKLVSNAIKFSPPEGLVQVKLERVDDGQVRVSVVDSGMGVSESAIERIFEKFVQEDASVSKTFGGSGLGLAISKELVERHHGEIGCFRNDSSTGMTFFFTLPLYEELCEETGQATDAAEEAQASNG